MLLFAQLCDRNFGLVKKPIDFWLRKGRLSGRPSRPRIISKAESESTTYKKEPRRAHFIDSEEFLTYEYLFCMPDTIVIGLDEIDAYR